MPDLGILVELADYYKVDIREIIDGERKGEKMERETETEKKETLLKIADYADKEKKQAVIRTLILFALEILGGGLTAVSGIMVIISHGKISAGYAVAFITFTFVVSIASFISCLFLTKKYGN